MSLNKLNLTPRNSKNITKPDLCIKIIQNQAMSHNLLHFQRLQNNTILKIILKDPLKIQHFLSFQQKQNLKKIKVENMKFDQLNNYQKEIHHQKKVNPLHKKINSCWKKKNYPSSIKISKWNAKSDSKKKKNQ